jgi:predicted PurR-regulated permease PerM
MLLAIVAIIVSILVLMTFVGTFVSASLSDFTINIPPENTTDYQNSQKGINTSEIEPPQGRTPSESITLRGLSPQGADDLAVACSLLPERC